ncbi:MAG: M20 family metallopeptidase [Lentimicrobiaceae bacterium]|nr:M20 family metallopeptidase [Lentimicrobiaceae bacterium]
MQSDKIRQLSREHLSEITVIRRHLHAHPELSGKEYETSEVIATQLTRMRIPFRKNIAGTGLLGVIEGKNPGKTVALRADMDALPITEKNEVTYASCNEGVMHACGHDAHMASLLGAAMILQQLRDSFDGKILLIFQPSEEKYPGGAIQMLQEGIFENEKPDSIIAQHVLPTLETGFVGMKAGKYMASTDEIYITVIGKGGHAATPELLVDPVLISAHILVALQSIVSRNAPPHIPTVLSFGKIVANGRTNVIPDKAEMEGTLRTFNEEWRKKAHKNITRIATSIAESMGGEAEVFVDKGYPFLVNDERLTQRAMKYAAQYLGKEKVKELDIRMTAEDFAYFSQQAPSLMYRLGIANASKEITSNLHTNTFDIDESSLETGMGLLAWFAICELAV